MTETTTAQTPTDQPATEPTPTETAPEAAEASRDGREAAKYRTRLRETEAERDALAARVEKMQRAQVEALAGVLAQPAALWAAGVTLDALLGEDGDVDPEKVAAAVTEAREALGLAEKPRTPRPDPTMGSGATASGPQDFAEAFKPKR